jgi:acyl-CoA thioester hydrolase
LTIFEVGRTELFRHYGFTYSDLESKGIMLPLVEQNSKYLNPAYYDDLLKIETIIKPEYKPLIRVDYNIIRDNTTIVKGYTIHSFMDEKTRKAVRPPKFFWEFIENIFNEK